MTMMTYIKCIEKKFKSFLIIFFIIITMYKTAIWLGFHPAVNLPFECYVGMCLGYIFLGAFLQWTSQMDQ
jgi:hypothetical protein